MSRMSARGLQDRLRVSFTFSIGLRICGRMNVSRELFFASMRFVVVEETGFVVLPEVTRPE